MNESVSQYDDRSKNVIPIMVGDKQEWIRVSSEDKHYYDIQFCCSGQKHAEMRRTVKRLMRAAYKQGQSTRN